MWIEREAGMREVRMWGRSGGLLFGVAMAVLTVGTAGGVSAQGRPEPGPPPARALVATAVERMGGEAALRAVERVRFDMTTQWQRTDFRDVPWTDRPSFEDHTDIRDYTIPAWRNTRLFPGRAIVNVVPDSVATTDLGGGAQPLSVAYVDEREELFGYTPDRLMLALLDAADLAVAGDTLVGGEPMRVVTATVGGWSPATVWLHAGTGLPVRLRFEAGHPNDYGLVPWGVMEVQVWYSNWRTTDGISIPTQWDILRMGRPYKRMTVRRADFAPVFAPADSFAVVAELRRRFMAEAAGPMHDRPMDSVSVVADGLVAVHGFGYPAGAVDVGDGWLLLESGHMPLNFERARRALLAEGIDRLIGATAISTRAGNGGALALAEGGRPVWTAPAAHAAMTRVMEQNGGRAGALTVVREGVWIGEGARRVRLEPVDLPDAPGSLVLWAPALGWLYAPGAIDPIDVRLVKDRAAELGWAWTALGTARALVVEGRVTETRSPPEAAFERPALPR
ncbi:hypothetical protein WI372_17060 [Gemmatimonadota bacterium DH-20]|uniref:Uncharacterized protein n=1 Tax=Gaopeijia maritima TaxID=3119007 RepID=A0ABU9ED87_9BACT